MQVITLNIWGGRAGRDGLLEFFTRHKDTDIFCLQEVWSAPYKHFEGAAAGGRAINHAEIMTEALQEISAILPDHVPLFLPLHEENYGLLMLIKKEYAIVKQGSVYVYKEAGYVSQVDIGDHARQLQWATIAVGREKLTIINFHGLWNGQGKSDSPDRLLQSEKIVQFLSTLTTPIVFVGDFNLNPDTESLQKIAAFPLRNLVKESGITTTRTSLYTKPEKFADYAFVSPELNVTNFQVLPDEVSDHLALEVEIKI